MKHRNSIKALPYRWIAGLMAVLLLAGALSGCKTGQQGDSSGITGGSEELTQPPATDTETTEPDETESPDDPETPQPPELITEISNAEDLVKFAESVNSGNHYEGVTVKLMADIDLDSIVEYVPIGWGEKMLTNSMGQPVSFAPYFAGTFDGNGHIIRGNLESRQEGFTGLFGMLSGAKVCNLGLELEIALNYCNLHHGALAGYAYNTTIENCYFKGSVTNAGSFDYEPDHEPDDNVGGLVGTAYGSLTIRNSYVDANMYRASRWSVGGLVGMIGAGTSVTVENCYSASTVSDCYGGDGDGCLLGNGTSINISVVNSYALDYGDPITGANIPPKIFDDVSGLVNINQLKGMAGTLGEAYQDNPNGFPALAWETVESTGEMPEPVYEIANLDDWNAFVVSVNAGYSYEGETVKLMADLNFAGVANFVPAGWNETYIEPGWGSSVNLREIRYFAGTFDGQGHCINGLSADAAHGCWGLFGTTYNATIKNLSVYADFTDHLNSQKFFAILIGLAYNTTVESCRVSGSYHTIGVNGFSTQCNGGVIGGAIGEVTIINTICDADLTGVAQTEGGAFVGFLWTNETSVTIENCYVYAPDVRALWWSPENIANSGVFAGGLQDGAELQIINSYALLTKDDAVTNLTVYDEKYLDELSRFVTLTELKNLAEILGSGYRATENGLPVLVWEDDSASIISDHASADESMADIVG